MKRDEPGDDVRRVAIPKGVAVVKDPEENTVSIVVKHPYPTGLLILGGLAFLMLMSSAGQLYIRATSEPRNWLAPILVGFSLGSLAAIMFAWVAFSTLRFVMRDGTIAVHRHFPGRCFVRRFEKGSLQSIEMRRVTRHGLRGPDWEANTLRFEASDGRTYDYLDGFPESTLCWMAEALRGSGATSGDVSQSPRET